jgi:hypothetical protein
VSYAKRIAKGVLTGVLASLVMYLVGWFPVLFAVLAWMAFLEHPQNLLAAVAVNGAVVVTVRLLGRV